MDKRANAAQGARNRYSTEGEFDYYSKSPEDRRAVPYNHLDQYVKGSFGIAAFKGKRVLDVGCGEGVYSAWIADRGGAREVVGVELTEHRIRRDYERCLHNLRFISGNFLDSLEEIGTFDIVFMNLVLHHLRFALAETAARIKEKLNPGGNFLAIEPNVYSPLALGAHVLHDRSANEGFLSPRRVNQYFAEAGFREIRIGYFWRNRVWARNPILASCFWVQASRPN